MNQPHVIGVISDTQGLLHPEVVEALQGSEQIIHAGDVGKPEVLDDHSQPDGERRDETLFPGAGCRFLVAVTELMSAAVRTKRQRNNN